jgi:hypothetical protein
MLRSFDAFDRPMDGLRKTSATGGVISLIALMSASILFFLQLYLYYKGEMRQDLFLAKSLTTSFIPPLNRNGATYEQIIPKSSGAQGPSSKLQDIQNARSKIPIKFQVTFPYIKCRDLEVTHDEASGKEFEKLHGKRGYRKNSPSLKLLRESELFPSNQNTWLNPGCVLEGALNVQKVGGTITIGVTQQAWNDAIMFINMGYKDPVRYKDENPGFFNIRQVIFASTGWSICVYIATFTNYFHGCFHCSHYISYMEFGDRFPLSHSPLQQSRNVIENDTGMGIQHVNVKLVPTTYKRTGRMAQDMYQVSVAQHTVQPDVLAQQHSPLMPGLVVYYDFTPLAVHHAHERENFFVFLSSIISIFGGVFVTVGLVSRCLVNAASIAKKMD